MKQVKGFLCGLLVGAMGITTVFAAGGIKSVAYNENKIIFNGRELYLNGQQMISVVKDGETNARNYMPVRGVLEAMGYYVEWDGDRNAVLVCSAGDEDFCSAVKSAEYDEWLTAQKKMLDEIGDRLTKLNNKKAIEDECVKIANDNPDILDLYVGFSDNTAVVSSGWVFDEGWKPTERFWYKLAISANGETVSAEPYVDVMTKRKIVSISKHIGKVEGVDAVLGVDLFVP